jgi:hypothetical protein
MGSGLTLDLLRRHLPVLRYDSQGSFMADSPAILTNRVAPSGSPANLLKRADGTVLASAAGGSPDDKLELGLLNFPRYRNGTRARRSDHLDAVGRDYVLQAREMHTAEFADRVYGRVAEAEDGGKWLQYWFFYLYNNKAFLGFGLHEGDWEMVQLRLDAGDRPLSMAFAQHSHGQRCRWEMVERRGERPVVYVARGSQASYASPGRHSAPVVPDHADGRGPEISRPTLEPLDDSEAGWVGWPGRWGSSKARSALESNSPRGPAHQDKWSEPEAFHEECDEIDPSEETSELLPPAPPAPAIGARRVGERALISYRFSLPRALPTPMALIVTLDSAQDALPPATYTHRLDSMSGEIEHPLPLSDDAYEVLVSAADQDGNVSEPVSTRLSLD